jgi:isoquinoline 1-oxidoreductase subunit alpha
MLGENALKQSIELEINGTRRRVTVNPDRSLLSVLREDLDLTGTKYGCGEAQCGACTVLMDGKAIRSCIMPASRASGKKITTIEGLQQNGKLHPVQQAFLDADAMQCSYCTSGMIMSAVELLSETPHPNHDQINVPRYRLSRATAGAMCGL